MKTPRISLIAALSKQTRAIGKDNALLWDIPADLQHFKQLTLGHPVIMGSKTYESIGRPLPGRPNIVVTHDTNWKAEGVRVCHSLDEAFTVAGALDNIEVFVIGGGMIYAQTIERADRLYLTLIDDPVEGDTYFPDYTTLPFAVTKSKKGVHNTINYEWATLDRT